MRTEELFAWPSHRRAWMGKYPRKGADWSPEEDAALLRAYESGRYLNKELAAHHMREPVAIERRLGVLRNRREGLPQISRNWPTEREAARQAVNDIRATFANALWPCRRGKSTLMEELRKFKAGDIIGGRVVIAVHEEVGAVMLSRVSLSDLPPEVAQALQFGGEA